MKNVVSNGEDLKIVGIVQPKESASSTMLSTGICYPASLVNHVIENAKNSKIVQDQLANPEVNVFTGKRFDDVSNDSSFDMNSLVEVDTNAIKSAFKIDQSKIKVDFGDLNNALSQNSLPTLDINEIISNINFSVKGDDIQKLLSDLLNGYQSYIQENKEGNWSEVAKQLSEYLQSKEVSELINNKIKEIFKEKR